jgi:hypothetical protein
MKYSGQVRFTSQRYKRHSQTVSRIKSDSWKHLLTNTCRETHSERQETDRREKRKPAKKMKNSNVLQSY